MDPLLVLSIDGTPTSVPRRRAPDSLPNTTLGVLHRQLQNPVLIPAESPLGQHKLISTIRVKVYLTSLFWICSILHCGMSS